MSIAEVVKIGDAALFHGDCRDILDDLSFDAIVTDPPYGVGRYTHKASEGRPVVKNLHSGGTWAAKEIYKDIDWDDETPDLTFLLELNVPTMVFGGNYFALPSNRKWIVWDKGEPFYRRTFAEAELCYCSFDGNTRIIKCLPESMGFGKQAKVHPTQKPVAVMQFCISELPKGFGNVVCDPFMGSGTTGVACVRMGRSFIGIEQKRKYFLTACQRIKKTYAEYKNQFPVIREAIETSRGLFE